MRKVTHVPSPARRRELHIQSRRRRIEALVVLVVLASLLCGTAFLLLPRTADGVAVTVRQCATVQDAAHLQTDFACVGTTLFERTVTDEATVSALRAALDGIHEVNPVFNNVACNAGDECLPTRVYSFDLLWHGTVVKSYWASVHRGARIFWEVRTSGVPLLATEDGPTTWQDVTRLTGMPVEPTAAP